MLNARPTDCTTPRRLPPTPAAAALPPSEVLTRAGIGGADCAHLVRKPHESARASPGDQGRSRPSAYVGTETAVVAPETRKSLQEAESRWVVGFEVILGAYSPLAGPCLTCRATN